MQKTFLEWSGNYSLRHDEVLPGYVEKEFKQYFKCGILAHGFARAYCANCGNDYILGFSCKKRGVCSRLNLHIHFHCVVFDGVFYTDQKGTLQFSDVYNFGKEDTDQVEARVRQRVLSLFKGHPVCE